MKTVLNGCPRGEKATDFVRGEGVNCTQYLTSKKYVITVFTSLLDEEENEMKWAHLGVVYFMYANW